MKPSEKIHKRADEIHATERWRPWFFSLFEAILEYLDEQASK